MSQTAEVAEPSAEEPTRGRPRMGTVLLIVAVVLLLATVVVSVLQWRRIDDLEDQQATRRAVSGAAAAFAQALLTYDFNDLSGARNQVSGLATDRFAQEYTSFFSGGVDVAITKLQATSKATVHDVYVRDAIGDTANAIVTLDSEVHSTAGTRYTTSTYLDLALVKQNGRWKVDNVTSVGSLDQRTVAPDGTVTSSGTTTTTTPVPTPESSSSSSGG